MPHTLPGWLAAANGFFHANGKKQEKKQRPKTTSLKLACWNIRTMQDSDEADRPQRRSALVARQLARVDIDIAALSEVRLAERGSLTEHEAGYTFHWSGKSKEDRRLSGVGFMLKNTLASKLTSLPVGHSDRIMSLRLILQCNQFATIISVYAPTFRADPETKEAFNSDLRSLLWKVESAKAHHHGPL